MSDRSTVDATAGAPDRPPAPGATPVAVLRRAEARIDGRVVWSDVDFTVGDGQFTAVLGPNGAGKTTLLRVLLGELPLAAGTVSVLGRAPGALSRQIGYLPQRRHFDAGIRIRGIDLEENLLMVEGAVPGSREGYVLISKAKTPPRERRGFAGSGTVDPLKASKKAGGKRK